jgi:hypothetical protein
LSTTSAWEALKYGLEKSTTRARSPVIVIAEMATSHFPVLSAAPDWIASKSVSFTAGFTPSWSATLSTRSMSNPTGLPSLSDSKGS